MAATFKASLIRILASPPPVEPPAPSRAERMLLLLGAMAAGGWIFAYKVRDFLGLGTTSDLYQFVQLSTSWLRGQFLHDNYYGDHLAIHTYLSCPLLGVLTIPFGAFGLLLALGLAAAFSVMAIVRILRLLGVPAGFALGYALVATLMPLSVQVYQDSIYGFHVELLEPCLALWLAWFLLRKNWLGSIVLAVVTCSIKEDAPLLVVVMAVTIMIEDLVRCGGAGWRRAWATPAGAVILLAVATVPLLLWIIKSQQVGVVSASLARLHPVREAGGITSNAALFSYIIANLTVWLRSDAVIAWLGLSFAATIGFILLRPHLLVIGVATTLIAWLMQDSLLWAPRFAQSLAFFQLTGCLAFASFCRLVREKPKRSPARAVLGLAAVAGLGWGLWQQWRTVPKVTEVYRLAPSSKISPSDRNQADRLFSVYRREGRADEPVMASPYLFRYAHDRNLVWPHSLTKRPQPVWILWDSKDTPLDGLRASLVADNGVDLSAYELKGRAGDFLLYRQKSGPGLQPVPLTAPVPITGEDHGAVKMLVRFAAARAGFSEPLLSLGRTGAGDVFFVRYLNYHQLVLGMESIGDAVLTSKPIEFEADHPYTLELFSGSLLPPAVDAADAKEAARRLYLQSLVSARLDGNEVLNALATPHVVQPAEVVAGLNAAGADSAAAAYFNTVWRYVLALTFDDDLPRQARPDGGERWYAVMEQLLARPDDAFWDDRDTGQVETRDDILATAMRQARDAMTRRESRYAQDWTWGHLHQLDLDNQTLGTSGVGPVERLLNRGGWEVGGGTGAVDATAWDASDGYRITNAPSMRMVVSLADLDASRWINLTGVSGHAFSSHYTDQTDLWAEGKAWWATWRGTTPDEPPLNARGDLAVEFGIS